MSGEDPLKTYRGKRHFERTAEPEGEQGEAGEGPRFVVQIHDATTTHFDFRLEAEGVLKSWSVPKGPSMDPKTKRLAMPTEDHPMDYRTFEGVIPRGEYGAGPVIVWDEGTYEPLKTDFVRALAKGHITFRLHGRKLRGDWALTRFRSADDGEREAWLLVKGNDGHAAPRPAPNPQRARSVLSDRTLHQVAEETAE
ncbi:DNA polymerase ligase N-terminal domain-containing protein [Streptomyces iconiensis]|uniref:DNA polymerase ligase N-terminal domain-containing protein n=1 Tax=Streptomyces iconiensis TaxID=1384038 RepID=A0ABT6ZVC6_9ACTN|nr:DNA polymerase ligase N-terminal domain-containing protein [Streptomyces iconiensis]MDJ1133027.1 DNA polymerase ligase N-terminal domain-containing protein [Streptomyces iconiensis]